MSVCVCEDHCEDDDLSHITFLCEVLKLHLLVSVAVSATVRTMTRLLSSGYEVELREAEARLRRPWGRIVINLRAKLAINNG